MSDQDKRAEEMPQRWKLERGPDGAWNTAQMTTTEDGEWCKAEDVAAALAQARREGVEAMLISGRNKTERVIDCCKPRMMIGRLELEAEAARLLAKEGL